VFRLHETTRRTFCRVVFLALCVAPTVAVLAWAASSNSSGRITNAERELTTALELAVEIDDIADPRPGVVVYSGIVLSDADTGRIVAKVEGLQAVETSEGTSLIASHAEADAQSLDRLWRVVDRRLRVGRATAERPLRMSIERLTLHGANSGDAVTFLHVGGQLVHDDASSRAGLRFSLPESASSEPVQLVVRRAHDAGRPTSRLELRTGGAPLPLAVLRNLFPALAHLGERADFSGQLWASRTGDDGATWTGELAGRLRSVDLDALVTRQFPHKLSGDADVALERFAFADGRLTRMAGRLEAGPGVVGQSLIDAAVDALAMRAASHAGNLATSESTNRRDDLLKYERLAVAFDIDGQHATLRGASPTTTATADQGDSGQAASLCVLGDAFGPLLFQAEQQPQSSLGLIRLLVRSAELQVPAAQETDWLLRRLPIPAATASSADEPPRANLRGAEAVDAP
jgi:hypothetical protein